MNDVIVQVVTVIRGLHWGAPGYMAWPKSPPNRSATHVLLKRSLKITNYPPL